MTFQSNYVFWVFDKFCYFEFYSVHSTCYSICPIFICGCSHSSISVFYYSGFSVILPQNHPGFCLTMWCLRSSNRNNSQNSGIHSICVFGIVTPNPAMAPHHKKVSSHQHKGSNNTHHECPVCTKEWRRCQWRHHWSQPAPLELVVAVEVPLELLAAAVHYGFMTSS